MNNNILLQLQYSKRTNLSFRKYRLSYWDSYWDVFHNVNVDIALLL